MITLGEALKNSTQFLVEVSDSPNLDAQTLIADRLGKSRAWILAHPEFELSDSIKQTIQRDIEQLKNGIPLPYVLGHWEFYGLDFYLTRETLIPRPETELLVENAVNWLNRNQERRWAADLGTGSGCIAISLARTIPTISFVATDISYPALVVARKNADRHEVVERILFIQSDLLPPMSRQFDLICANLPYIPSEILATLKVAKGEPKLALDGGQDGLDLIQRFFEFAPDHTAPGGFLLIEIEASQGPAVSDLASQSFPSAEINVVQDLAGLDRLVTIQLV